MVELEPALAAAVGAGNVHTAAAQLDAYTADTYWPALSARAAQTISSCGASTSTVSTGRTERSDQSATGTPTATRIAATTSENW